MSEQDLKQQIIEKAWSDEAFKAQLLADPKAALKDAFGLDIPADVEIVIVEETATKVGLVIPQHPSTAGKPNNVEFTW